MKIVWALLVIVLALPAMAAADPISIFVQTSASTKSPDGWTFTDLQPILPGGTNKFYGPAWSPVYGGTGLLGGRGAGANAFFYSDDFNWAGHRPMEIRSLPGILANDPAAGSLGGLSSAGGNTYGLALSVRGDGYGDDDGGEYDDDEQPVGNPVAEPASLLLLGSGLGVLARRLRRKQ